MATNTLTEQAQKGLDYIRTTNPMLADQISKNFASAGTAPIDASSIGTGSTINVPPPVQTAIPDYTKVSVSTPPIVNTARQNELDADREGIVADITATGDKLATKSARKSELETAQNIPVLSTQLNEILGQIRNLDSEALVASEKAENRLAPTFAISGEQAAIERQRAVRKYGLAAVGELIQGNIAIANDNVDRALDAEFGGLEQEIKNKEILLKLNMDNFDREEKRAAETRQTELERQKEELANARAERQNVYSVLQIAAQYEAPNDVLNRILSSPDMGSAIAAAGKYLVDPAAKYELEGLKLTNDLRRAQIITEKAQAAKIRAESIPTAGVPIPSVSDSGSAVSGYKSDIVNAITGLKLNESQSNAVSYAFRMIESNVNINNQLGNGSDVQGTYNPTTLGSAIGRLARTDNARTLERDLENFIRAQLRKESGATITDTEMDGGRKIYSPQGVMTNKRDVGATKTTREQAIQSMISQAGPAGKHLKAYYDYMQTGGLTPEERAIIYGGAPGVTTSTPSVVSGMKYY